MMLEPAAADAVSCNPPAASNKDADLLLLPPIPKGTPVLSETQRKKVCISLDCWRSTKRNRRHNNKFDQIVDEINELGGGNQRQAIACFLQELPGCETFVLEMVQVYLNYNIPLPLFSETRLLLQLYNKTQEAELLENIKRKAIETGAYCILVLDNKENKL